MHGHDHSGGQHHHGPRDYGRAFAIGITLNLLFVIIEFIYGHIAHSLALSADAGHNLSDVLSLLLAWVAAVLSRTAPTQQRTFGMRRSSILAALVNAALLLVAIGAIGWEAVRRFAQPLPAEGKTVMIVAGVGIAINSLTALLFWSGRRQDVNIRGAFLHMAADAAVSAGVVVGGYLMLVTGWLWLDPAISLAIVVLIFLSTWALLRDALILALDFVPANVDPEAIQQYLGSLPEVAEVHDLHIWSLSTTEAALTAHLVLKPGASLAYDALLRAEAELHERFKIDHSTLQVEGDDAAESCRCRLQSARPWNVARSSLSK
jgi:cobalt-zinc-cadmium efflux system protein